MSDSDLMMGSIHGPGYHVCGIAPRLALTAQTDEPCWNCAEFKVVRRFSGSGWYEDDYLCAACGEDVATGSRPFERAWRKKNIARAEKRLAVALPYDEFKAKCSALVQREMGWMDDKETRDE